MPSLRVHSLPDTNVRRAHGIWTSPLSRCFPIRKTYPITMKMGNIALVNLEDIIKVANGKVLDFILQFQTKSRKDLTNLFIFFAFGEMFEVFNQNRGLFVFFFLSDNCYETLTNGTYDVSYKKFFKVVMKSVKFPVIQRSCTFEMFTSTLTLETPLYDELLLKATLLSELFPKLVKVIKQLRFYKYQREVVDNLLDRAKFLHFSAA